MIHNIGPSLQEWELPVDLRSLSHAVPAQVPNLMANEDIEEIGAAMRPLLAASGQAPTKMAQMALFINRVRSFLHIVLCFSPVGDAFRQRLRMFPSLVNCCTIDWFREWPMEALKSVARSVFADVELDTPEQPDLTSGVIDCCVYIHQSVEHKSKKFYDELRRCVLRPDCLAASAPLLFMVPILLRCIGKCFLGVQKRIKQLSDLLQSFGRR